MRQGDVVTFNAVHQGPAEHRARQIRAVQRSTREIGVVKAAARQIGIFELNAVHRFVGQIATRAGAAAHLNACINADLRRRRRREKGKWQNGRKHEKEFTHAILKQANLWKPN